MENNCYYYKSSMIWVCVCVCVWCVSIIAYAILNIYLCWTCSKEYRLISTSRFSQLLTISSITPLTDSLIHHGFFITTARITMKLLGTQLISLLDGPKNEVLIFRSVKSIVIANFGSDKRKKNCTLANKWFNYGWNGRVLWSWPRKQLFTRFYHSYKTTERIRYLFTFHAERQAKSHRFSPDLPNYVYEYNLQPYTVWVRPLRCSSSKSSYSLF